MKDDYSFGEVNIEAHVHSDYSSVEGIVKMGKEIWERIKGSGVDPRDEKGNEFLFASLFEEYKPFCVSYPLVMKWAVFLRSFDAKILEKFIIYCAKVKIETREDFLKVQANYPVMLQRRLNGHHANEKKLAQYKSHIINELIKEDKEFIEANKKLEAELKERDAARRQELFNVLTKGQ